MMALDTEILFLEICNQQHKSFNSVLQLYMQTQQKYCYIMQYNICIIDTVLG